MPRYLVKSLLGTGSDGCCCDNSIDRNSAIFFNKLATKLLDMTRAIDAKIEEIEKKCKNTSNSTGFYFASIETPKMTLGVKYEYIEYITRYGPPENGKFDEAILQALRDELGISNTATTI